jgi:hypothetical protein
VVLLLGQAEPEQLIDNFFQIPGLYPGLWLWWFLFLMGGQLALVLLVIRLVEFRGRGRSFGRKTLAWRRYGYVAFTIYTYQFIDVVPRLLYQLFPDLSRIWPYPDRMDWLPVLVLVPMTLLLWEVVLRLWEKVEYAGGMEWCLAKVSEKLLPGRRDFTRERKRWWQAARLDAKEYLYRPEWLDIVKRSEVDPQRKEDSKLSLILAITGVLFFPMAFLGIALGRAARKYEGKNGLNTAAIYISIGSLMVYTIIWTVLFLIPLPEI